MGPSFVRCEHCGSQLRGECRAKTNGVIVSRVYGLDDTLTITTRAKVVQWQCAGCLRWSKLRAMSGRTIYEDAEVNMKPAVKVPSPESLERESDELGDF